MYEKYNLHWLLHEQDEDEYGYPISKDIEVCFCFLCRQTIGHLFYEIESKEAQEREKYRKNNPDLYEKVPIHTILRMKVFKRDNFTCKNCGFSPDNEDDCKMLCADHIHPEKHGGKATLDNLQTLCRKCNSSKGSKILTDNDK
jgi:5-methylcytosine-specific restriction endonuclease McrA